MSTATQKNSPQLVAVLCSIFALLMGIVLGNAIATGHTESPQVSMVKGEVQGPHRP